MCVPTARAADDPAAGVWVSLSGLTAGARKAITLSDTASEALQSADAQSTFADLGVIPEIVEALKAVGIEHPFPIQSLAIPIAINGTDMIGQARTGTGKTLAFGVSLLQRVVVKTDPGYADHSPKGKPQALVMCPTRELALQVADDLEVASSVRKARVLTVYGGVGYDTQVGTLTSGVDIVVGTPGRLLDLVTRRSLDLSAVKVLVLDEADEMLDMGFLPDVERLISKTPPTRQTMLFSATMPSAVVGLARMYLNQPVNVRAETQDASVTVPEVDQFVYQAHDLDKPEIIGRLLQAEGCTKTIIFTRTKRSAQRLADELTDRGFSVGSLHGDLNQVLREKSLKRFHAGKVDVLVATDVAARGIDVTGVSHVVNYECPDDDKTYVHRIGRTGRAGAKGVAITLVDWADLTRWKVINKTLDLGFPDPTETYSTSHHLFTELGIAPGTKGRIAPPKEAEPRKPREPRERGPKAERVETSDGRVRRQRRRRSGGDKPVQPESAEATPTQSAPGEASDKPRRRRRRRSSGTKPAETAPAE
ncbi:DEAD/DEAH box helicase [Micropruina sp.]|uniref:DEAD/DEAH box helicase n=1 Tax=Micropruina sp. TaxID=2737536 RepID=UPI00261C8C58|nr:DEAD/DEAH box helicase [Micropruina sp.]